MSSWPCWPLLLVWISICAVWCLRGRVVTWTWQLSIWHLKECEVVVQSVERREMVTMDKAHPPWWKGKVEDDFMFQDFQGFRWFFLRLRSEEKLMLQPWRLLLQFIFLCVLLESLGWTWPGHVCRSTWRARKYVATWPWPFESWNSGRSGRHACEAHFQELEHLVESNSWIFCLERRGTRLVGEHGNSFSWWSRKMEISRHGDCVAILVWCGQGGEAQRLRAW